MARPGVALQLYTVREEMRANFIGTVRAVAGIGYPAVQLGGNRELAPADLKRLLDDLHLAVAGSHIGLDRLENNLEQEIDDNIAVGNRDLVCPALPQALRQDEAGFRQAAATLNAVGARCQQRGVRLSYHNHAFEFVRLGGQTAMELLLAETDPQLVWWEPDVYWIAYANEDPAQWIRRYAGRSRLVHLKDMTSDATRTFAEVGEGHLDFASIFVAAEEQGAEWYVVEQDRCARPALESAALSLRHLREWGKV
ncbi:MAG: TIM barrel protein [Chloroflexi bacterium]|nr:TIM barrel protein [Chloroflexota bacterium]